MLRRNKSDSTFTSICMCMGMTELEDTKKQVLSVTHRHACKVAVANVDGNSLCLTRDSNIVSGIDFDDVIFPSGEKSFLKFPPK